MTKNKLRCEADLFPKQIPIKGKIKWLVYFQ